MSKLEVIATAPGKVNLYFAVGDVQSDGYHSVASLYAAVSLKEEVTASVHDEPGISLSMEIPEDSVLAQMEANGDFDRTSVPLDNRNLVYKAAQAVLESQGLSTADHGIHLHIIKNVPVAGGMAGGSADAAAALKAVNQLVVDAGWANTLLSTDELMRLGAVLGADVPFCLMGGIAIGYGNGTELTPVEIPEGVEPVNLVMVLNTQGLSTPAVFAELDRGRAICKYPAPGELKVPDGLIEATRSFLSSAARLHEMAHYLRNDLSKPAIALAPELEQVLKPQDELIVTGFVSGSGPTIALLTQSEEDAHHLVTMLMKRRQFAVALKTTY